jgi:hypothetical protein
VTAKHFSMIREFHLADALTLANAACGVAAVLCAMLYMGSHSSAHYLTAAALTPAALIFDWLGGTRILPWAGSSIRLPTSSRSGWRRQRLALPRAFGERGIGWR